MNTTENNKIIAEFMGGKMVTNHIDCKQISFLRDSKAIPPTDEGIYTLSMLKYNSDWNWLMNVVRKVRIIESKAKGEFLAELLHYKRNNRTIFDLDILEGIEWVYNACIAFIEWYNKQ